MIKTRIQRFDIEIYISNLWKAHCGTLRVFFLLLGITIIIFGQKLFSYSLATDDYSRFFSPGYEQASFLGRWFSGILNSHIFTTSLHIQPYWHGFLGIVAFTASGFLTASIWQQQQRSSLRIIISLMCTVTPFVAHNLYFNTNVGLWFMHFFGVLSLYLAYKKSVWIKACAMIFLVLSVGTYQTIIQVCIAIIAVKTLLNIIPLQKSDSIGKEVGKAIGMVGFVVLAFLLSNAINFLYLDLYDLTASNRYADAFAISGIEGFIQRLYNVYFGSGIRIEYFLESYFLLLALFLLAYLFNIWCIAKKEASPAAKTLKIVLFLLFFLVLHVIVHMPRLFDNAIPTRAHYTIGWLMAGFFLFTYYGSSQILKNLGFVLTGALILLNSYYINVFYDAAARQTSSDILNANQLVTRIRSHQQYSSEDSPLQLRLVGLQKMAVPGWNSRQQYAFRTNWSKYAILQHFTDLNFVVMPANTYRDIENNLIAKNMFIDAYPAKSSIIFTDNKVVIFLDAEDINLRMAETTIQQ